MINFLLYFTTVIIWGSTWLAIQFQLGTVAPVWSLVYRFAIAALILFSYCQIKGLNMKFTRKEHGIMFAQGMLLFALNYLFFYKGSQYFISGLMAVIFSGIILMNIVNARIFLNTPMSLKIILGAIIGIAGLCFVFHSQFETTDFSVVGLLLCLAGVLVASWGNILSAVSQKERIPIIQSNAYGMFYGVLVLTVYALITGEKPSFDFSLKYSLSLLYLSVFGSVIAFGAYFQLLGRIGPSRAAYAFVVLPIVSLAISTVYESFTWTHTTFWGVFLIVLGNLLIILFKNENKKEEKTA